MHTRTEKMFVELCTQDYREKLTYANVNTERNPLTQIDSENEEKKTWRRSMPDTLSQYGLDAATRFFMTKWVQSI